MVQGYLASRSLTATIVVLAACSLGMAAMAGDEPPSANDAQAEAQYLTSTRAVTILRKLRPEGSGSKATRRKRRPSERPASKTQNSRVRHRAMPLRLPWLLAQHFLKSCWLEHPGPDISFGPSVDHMAPAP